jgi:SWI/SNF related-matrix-associated actin-dependent regulator of chromatin subfamily C
LELAKNLYSSGEKNGKENGAPAPQVNGHAVKKEDQDPLETKEVNGSKETNEEQDIQKETPKKIITYSCTTCGVDCTASRYHCSKHPIVDLCPNCYLDGRFPSTLFTGDFLKLETQGPQDSNGQPLKEWTDQETLLLLEGIELFEEDWSRVAEHVGTRSRDECLLKFLELPIEDPYLGQSKVSPSGDATVPSVSGPTQSQLGPLQYSRIPFSPADNPILTLTAFLASVVPAQAAQEAAKAAVAQLSTPKTSSSSEEKGHQEIGLQKAGATALGAAAAKASVLSDNESKELQSLTNALLSLQLKKMELKLSHFQDIENLLEFERQSLERERQQLYLDRLAFRKTVLSLAEVIPGGLGAVQPGSSLNDYVNLEGEGLLMDDGEGEDEVSRGASSGPLENAQLKTLG